MIDQSLIAKISSLSAADRLELIRVVWDSLSPDELPMTDAEKALIDSRLADMESHPDDQSPWPAVKERLERSLTNPTVSSIAAQ
jgi:putative addiction module component (TIGR02574 family)